MPSKVPCLQHLIQHKLTILHIRRNNKPRGRHAEHLLHNIHNSPCKLPQFQLLQLLLQPIDSSRKRSRRANRTSSSRANTGYSRVRSTSRVRNSSRSHIPNSIPAVPSLERSGSEHREGAVTSFLLRFLSTARGTEGVVKTLKRLG